MRKSAAPSVVILACLLIMMASVFVSAQLQPTFVLGFSSSISIHAGDRGSLQITVTSIQNFDRPVYLSASGVPVGVYVSFDNNPVTPPPDGSDFSTATISVDASVHAGTYHLKLVGTSGEQMKNYDLALDVIAAPPGDFGISISPSSVSIKAGSSATTGAYVNSVNGFSSSVSLSASGQPGGVMIDFSPKTVVPPAGGTASSIVTVSTTSNARAGSYVVTITGSGNGGQVMLQHSTELYLQITSTPTQDFTIAVNPSSIGVQQGQSASASVMISPIGGFNSPVSLGTSGRIPAGVQISFSPNPTYGASTMTVAVASSSTRGTYSIMIVGASGSLSHAIAFALTISSQAQPGFSMAASPTSVSLTPSGSSTVSIVVTSINGFSSPVSVSTSWSGQTPNGISITGPGTLTPTPAVAASGTLVITGSANAQAGSYVLTVVGVSGPITAQATVTVQVVKQQRADFTVAANPGTVSITTGATGSTVLTVLSKKGFNSPVALSANWQGPNPGGVSFTLQSPVTPTSGSAATSTLTITATPAAVPGTYTLIVTGSSGALLHTAQVTIVISQLITTTTSTTSGSTPQCFIATATYGSPLAPEVQFLRTFRDREIMSTYVGWNFMIVFNAWYYSFSPSVAQSITQHATFQGAMKLILYPAITILRLGVTPFVLFPAHRELAAVLSGLLVSTMIGLVYLTIPAALILGRANRARRIGTRMDKALAMVLTVSLLAIVTAEFSSSGILMMLSSVTAILSTLTLSTLLSSQALVQVIRSRTHQ